MRQNNGFFIALTSIIIGTVFSTFDSANAASRVAVRSTPGTATRRSVGVALPQTTNTNSEVATTETLDTAPQETVSTKEEDKVLTIENKSSSFDVSVSAGTESSVSDNSFAEQIRKQRAAFEASEATTAATTAQQTALRTGSNTCDKDLRKCMATKCGNDFTKCALDGDTMFGDKLNACRRDTECTGEEFSLFTAEIKADRDMNVRLASYNNVINCGNQYNACLVNECGKTYNKCLGKAQADAATKKCSTIAKECVEADSGLANRFGTAIGKLRENAEKEVKKDDERMYAMRDSMQSVCKRMGAMFDERTFDCVFTVNFFAGNSQKEPMASRKRYAGDTFVCMQEWFGVDTTTYKENAYRETRAQTGASSAMLGSGVGTAVGLISSGAIDRALDTQKAKNALNAEKKAQQVDDNNNNDKKADKKQDNENKNKESNSGSKLSITKLNDPATVFSHQGKDTESSPSNENPVPTAQYKGDYRKSQEVKATQNENKSILEKIQDKIQNKGSDTSASNQAVPQFTQDQVNALSKDALNTFKNKS